MASLRRDECGAAVKADQVGIEWAKAVAQARIFQSKVM